MSPSSEYAGRPFVVLKIKYKHFIYFQKMLKKKKLAKYCESPLNRNSQVRSSQFQIILIRMKA